jgi:hypothetical protein
MPPVNWDAFERLPGGAESNFEMLCRALVRRHYGRYGDFAALAQQAGVEFHLRLHAPCALGEPGRWYGWQCRWYDLPGGRAIGARRREKIVDAITKTERHLPDLTDWVLWTRRPLTEGDQRWFNGLGASMRLHLWTAAEVEEHLSGPAEILRRSYFGELVLTPEALSDQHRRAVAPIRQRWQPEVHQIVDAERTLRRTLGETETWDELTTLADQLDVDATAVDGDVGVLTGPLATGTAGVAERARVVSDALNETHAALAQGDLDLLRQRLAGRPGRPSQELAALPRRLRAARSKASLTVTNALADDRRARSLLTKVDADLGERLIAVLADAGCGKTELAAQLTAAVDDRPAGILLQGRDLHAGHDLDDLAGGVVIQGLPVSSMEALVAAVDAAGQRARRRLPIVIDGLNEAEDPRDWKSALASLDEALWQYPYVLVVCTVRTAFADEALPADIIRLEIPDFDHDTVDAVRRYFEYYRIDPVDAELPWGLLRHPLTLRFFCEVTNPTRESVVGVEAMPGSLTALFDRYLKQAAERIVELAPRTHRYYEQDVRKALYEIGVALWDEKARSLDYTALRQLLGDSGRPWDQSLVRALEQEGVLLRFPGDTPGGDRMAVVFDALAGHVVADALLAKHGRTGLEEQLRDPATVDALAGPLSEQHPLASDTLRALVGLVPRMLHAQQLWTMLDEPLRTDAVLAAADLEGDYIDAATVDELAGAAARAPSGRRDLFDRLRSTRGSPKHPLNAEFLDDALRPMSVADRDVRWTEWVRRHQDETLGDLRRLEQRWHSDPARTPADQLLARWVMWMLTSTVRVLRDQATRTLYWFGRAGPVALFDLTIDALDINDPYVPERMLAAGYGVAMALQHDAENGAFVDEVLPHATEQIYEKMFAPGAPHATTHLLARNYARRVIEIAARHRPGVLTEEQLERTRPPYEEDGIREWGESVDRNEGEYRDGNHPFGFLDDDPMDRLGPNISKYRSDTPQYKQAKANLWWRIYDLGYSLEKFGSVDGLLASSSYRRSSHEDGSWVDGYGRKYSWIATCELAGLKDDLGLLKSEWEEEQENWTHVDLDPSFPEELPSYELVSGDLLGDREQNLRDWISSGPSLTFDEILVLNELQGEPGPWVLLWGYLTQDDREAKRRMFCFLQGAILDASEADEVAETVGQVENVDLHSMLPDTHYTYAGKIPWCETYPPNEPFSVTITKGYETVARTETETHYFRGDERLSKEECYEAILDRLPDDALDAIGTSEEGATLAEIQRVARELDIREAEQSVTREVKVPDNVVRAVTMPVTGHGWEDYHSELNPSTGANTPARQIADLLGLVGKPQTFDLYDSSGRRASATFRHGEQYSDKQEFTYLRKDLLDRYLEESGQRLMWHIFGERAILERDPGARRASEDGPPYVRYDEVRVYD